MKYRQRIMMRLSRVAVRRPAAGTGAAAGISVLRFIPRLLCGLNA